MIAVYGQALDRQGLIAVIDSELVDAADVRFVRVRQKSKALNLRPADAKASGTTVHVGFGIVRIQIDTNQTEEASRVVVVLPSRSLLQDDDRTLAIVLRSAAVIERYLEPSHVVAALSLTAQVVKSAERRKLVALGVSFSIFAIGVAALALALAQTRQDGSPKSP